MDFIEFALVPAVAGLIGLVTAFFTRGESRRVEIEAEQSFDELITDLIADERRVAGQESLLEAAEGSPSGTNDLAKANAVSPPPTRPVAREVALMRKYHAQGLGQSRSSFIISVVFAALGFGVIVFALLTTDRSDSLSQQSLPVISAVVLEAVASLFFVQSNRAQQMMVEFFDRLRTDRRLEEALQLTDKMPDPKLRARMMLVLGLSLAERPMTDELLSVLIDASTAEAMADRRGVAPTPPQAPEA